MVILLLSFIFLALTGLADEPLQDPLSLLWDRVQLLPALVHLKYCLEIIVRLTLRWGFAVDKSLET